MIYKYSALFIIFCLMSCISACYEDNKISWVLDTNFSQNLTFASENFKSLNNGKEIQSLVDEIRIFKLAGKKAHMYSLKYLFKQDIFFSTKDQEEISNIILAAQENLKNVTGEKEWEDEISYYFVMLNSSNMQAGYFIYKKLRMGGIDYGKIIPYQPGSSFYYNDSLKNVLTNLSLKVGSGQ
jgi:hypothetical protein